MKIIIKGSLCFILTLNVFALDTKNYLTISLEDENTASKIELKHELAKKFFRHSLYKQYKQGDCDSLECSIADRYLECLILKWELLGEFARRITPANLKEVHYIVTSEIKDLENIPQEKIIKEFIQLNEVIFNSSEFPPSEYEREKIAQDAYSQYMQEKAVHAMWKEIELQN